MEHTVVDMSIAKKYAQAFMSSFPRVITLSSLDTIHAAQQFLQTHRRTLYFLQLPQFTAEHRVSMLTDMVEHFSLSQDFIHLFLLLITHNRSFYIPAVLSWVIELYKKEHGIVNFTVMSAHHLTDNYRSIIKRFLDTMTGQNSICSFVLNTSLIAGMRMKSNECQWEYSVRKQLKQLKKLEI